MIFDTRTVKMSLHTPSAEGSHYNLMWRKTQLPSGGRNDVVKAQPAMSSCAASRHNQALRSDNVKSYGYCFVSGSL